MRPILKTQILTYQLNVHLSVKVLCVKILSVKIAIALQLDPEIMNMHLSGSILVHDLLAIKTHC